MYCSSCGGAVPRGLGFCNHCGARLSPKAEVVDKQPEMFPDSLIWAIVTVFIVGLGGTIGLLAVMNDVFGRQNIGLIILFTLLSFALTLAVEGILIWLLFSRRRSARKVEATERLKEPTTKELATADPRLLPEPVPSITEHTTRAFEPIYTERESN